MQYLLSRACRADLLRLAHERTLCAFDFDGTLSPIVEHPEQAGMSHQTRILLDRLAALYPCVIVSGRARADLLNRLNGVKVERVIGNHGAETEATTPKPHLVAQWKAVMERELGGLPGVWVEDKGLSLAVHYRQAPQKPQARRQILAATRNLDHVHAVGGKLVVNLVVDRAPNKGKVLAAERSRLGCNWVLFVGDDENDEDAFALDGNIIPVRVGRKRYSHARYYLRTQAEIDTLLELLVRLRSPVKPSLG
jgi:trehalose 6-phosphate phosphatase